MTPGLCEQCGQRPATVHVTQIINGQKTEHHLCNVCAEANGTLTTLNGWGIGPLLGGLFPPAPAPVREPREARCPACGWTPSQFQATGRMGCDRCYEAFQPGVLDLARRIHGAGEHRGKVPGRSRGATSADRELEQLRQQLAEAIRTEAFEQAALLRDRIRALEQQRGVSSQ